MLKKLTAAFGRFFFARKSVEQQIYKHYSYGEKTFDRVIKNPKLGAKTIYLCSGEITGVHRIWSAEGWGL